MIVHWSQMLSVVIDPDCVTALSGPPLLVGVGRLAVVIDPLPLAKPCKQYTLDCPDPLCRNIRAETLAAHPPRRSQLHVAPICRGRADSTSDHDYRAVSLPAEPAAQTFRQQGKTTRSTSTNHHQRRYRVGSSRQSIAPTRHDPAKASTETLRTAVHDCTGDFGPRGDDFKPDLARCGFSITAAVDCAHTASPSRLAGNGCDRTCRRISLHPSTTCTSPTGWVASKNCNNEPTSLVLRASEITAPPRPYADDAKHRSSSRYLSLLENPVSQWIRRMKWIRPPDQRVTRQRRTDNGQSITMKRHT